MKSAALSDDAQSLLKSTFLKREYGGFSTSVPLVCVFDSAVELIDPTALRCISFDLCEMRSETVPERCGMRAS